MNILCTFQYSYMSISRGHIVDVDGNVTFSFLIVVTIFIMSTSDTFRKFPELESHHVMQFSEQGGSDPSASSESRFRGWYMELCVINCLRSQQMENSKTHHSHFFFLIMVRGHDLENKICF